jgi:DNA (cytosine-5)-methyltransferase 1
MRWIELFAGIGGAACALRGRSEVVRAVDHDEACERVYGANFGHSWRRVNLDTAKPDVVAGADAWWMSPPCQPYTVRGKGGDLDDPRAKPFVRVMALLEAAPPQALAMENVPGFAGSRAHAALRALLRRVGYDVREHDLCPTELGVHMVRRRWYLVADRGGLGPFTPARRALRVADALTPGVDRESRPGLYAEPALLQRYGSNLPLVDARDPEAVAHCFTGAYGVSPVYSGSWLLAPDGVRRFLPEEILRMLGFPEGYQLPVDKPAKAYKLVGNSLSVDAARSVLSAWGG